MDQNCKWIKTAKIIKRRYYSASRWQLNDMMVGSITFLWSLYKISSKSVLPLRRYYDFLIFKMATAAILDFWNREILLVIGVQSVEMHQYAKLRQNRSIGCEDTKIFQFFTMAAVRNLGFVWGIFGPQQWVFGGLYHSAKFGYDRCSSFYNMNISIFGPFRWKMPINAPKIGVFVQFETLNELQYQPTPKMAHTRASPRHLNH